jgi:CheY-like chemotaxis protein
VFNNIEVDCEIVSRRVLVVDDELLIALDLEQMLVDMGACVVGPATNLDSALELAANEQIDCAFLDVNLGGNVSVAPVVDTLRARCIPSCLRRAMARMLL